MANLVRVIGVDVGSVRPANSPKFAWAAYDVLADSSSREHSVGDGVEPEGAASAVVSALNASRRVALGLESPLVLPVPDDWRDLARRREGEAQRAWSAGAGASVMGTGLVQLAWLLGEVKRQCGRIGATTQPATWSDRVPLLLWEAFVSGASKTDRGPEGHVVDARAAAQAFIVRSTRLDELCEVHVGAHGSFNLAAAAALQAGLTIDPAEIASPLLVFAGALA